MTEIDVPIGEEVTFKLGGRTVHLWTHDCEACTSLDVWTDRGREKEGISCHTGDTSRAPTGIGLWKDGRRPNIPGAALPSTHGWPAYATVNLIWHDQEES